MPKTKEYALRLLATTAVVSAFGFALRWAQNISAFEEGTGLAERGALTSWLLILLTLGTLIGLAVLLLPTLSYGTGEASAQAVRGDGQLYRLGSMLIGAALCIAGAIILISAGAELYPTLLKVLGALAILSGGGIICTGRGGKAQADSPLCCVGTIAPVLFGCFWLIVSYKNHAANPVIWQYAVEILAVTAITLALYFIAGFVFCRPKLFHTCLSCSMAAYLCFTALGDTRAFVYQLIFGALGLYFLLTLYTLLCSIDPQQKSFKHLKESE